MRGVRTDKKHSQDCPISCLITCLSETNRGDSHYAFKYRTACVIQGFAMLCLCLDACSPVCRLILDALGTASSHACRLELVSGFQTAMQWLCEVEQTGHGHAACSSGAGAGAEKSTHSQARVESGEGKGEGASRRTNTRAASAAGAEAGAGARQGIQAGGAVGTVAAATAVTSGGTGVGTSGSNHAKQPAGAGPALQHQQQQQQQQQQEAAPVALPVMLSTKASGVQAYVAVARAAICAKPVSDITRKVV